MTSWACLPFFTMPPWAAWTTISQCSPFLKPFYEKSSPFLWPGFGVEERVWWCPEMERSGWRQTWPNLRTAGLQEGGEVGSWSDETIPLPHICGFSSKKLEYWVQVDMLLITSDRLRHVPKYFSISSINRPAVFKKKKNFLQSENI